MSPASLAQRAAVVRERIETARERAGRTQRVTLVAVTKTHPAEVVRAAREAGIEDVGENRVQELERKVEEVGREGLRWHLIGHLQRNKVRAALPLFDLLHSLDSLRLAEKLSEEAVAAGREVRALVQVNTSGEESKYGFSADASLDALGEICELPGLRIEGLMTMAPFTEEEAILRATFAAARRLQEEAGRQISGFQPLELSMGMSNDFEIAVEEGSTLVRLGTVLFGERDA
ncbi:MAG: YggS family pyridoxal phosphate-dependent enzyme [Longimicrobiaceae bacterium]